MPGAPDVRSLWDLTSIQSHRIVISGNIGELISGLNDINLRSMPGCEAVAYDSAFNKDNAIT